MLTYPSIDPVALDLGLFQIHWYGITYIVGFAGSWVILTYRAKVHKSRGIESFLTPQFIEDMVFYTAIGVILGGRLGYTLFYNMDVFLNDPISILKIWEGGMSFHGGLIGVLTAMWLLAKKYSLAFFQLTDEIALAVPFGLASGRVGNFINAELWGRPTDLPWAMVFPTDPYGLARHPSMIYEFILEGVVLLLILWIFASKMRPLMSVSALFLIFYGLFRFSVEFVRQPDAHMGDGGFIYGNWLTQGMLLSLPMIILGCFILYRAYQRKPST